MCVFILGMTETALDRASQVWGGVAVQHNDAPKPKDVDKFVFPTSTPTIRETPDYMTRTKSLGHLIDACGEYFDDLHERYKLPFQFTDDYCPSDKEIGAAIIGKKSVLDFRTGTHVNKNSPMFMRLRINKDKSKTQFDWDDNCTVFERHTFWSDDFRTGVSGQPDGGMTIEKVLVTFMLAEEIVDNDELAQLWSHMPDGLKADECPEDGLYPALWAGQFDHSEVLLKNLQYMIDKARKDDHLRGHHPQIL